MLKFVIMIDHLPSGYERGFGFTTHEFEQTVPGQDTNAVRIDVEPRGSTAPVVILNPETELLVKVVSGHAQLEVTNIFEPDSGEENSPQRIELDPNSWPVSLRHGDAYRWINLSADHELVLIDTAKPVFKEGDEQDLTVSPDDFFRVAGGIVLYQQTEHEGALNLVDSLSIPMKSDNAAIIDWEITKFAYNKDTGEEHVTLFINNFAQNLPGGLTRETATKYNAGDTWFTRMHPDSLSPKDREYYSQRVQDTEVKETFDSFFASVDAAIQREIDEGTITLDELTRIQGESMNAKQDKDEKQEALSRYILPVYRRLRMMGYSHFDLAN